jgi:hypothetical protein
MDAAEQAWLIKPAFDQIADRMNGLKSKILIKKK